MKLYPFHINTSRVENLTTEQLNEAKYRCARDFGKRAGFSPIAYIFLLASITIATDIGSAYFKDYWFLVIMVYVISIGRYLITQKLAVSEKDHYRLYLNNYYILTLAVAFLWGAVMAMMLWTDQLQNFSYLLLSLTIAMTAGAIGTMTSYVRTSLQFIFMLWLPIVFVLALLSYTDCAGATLVLYLVVIMLFFVATLASRIALDNQSGILRQILLESQSNELILALETIKQQQSEVKKHRDHLQNLVDEKTIDLIKAKEKAEQADITKSEFLANMSHELRTPLHSILSFSHFGLTRLDQVDSEKIRSYFEKINYSGEIQLNLVNDLLDLSHLESNKANLFFKQCNLLAITKSIIDELSSLYEQKNMTLSLDEPSETTLVNGDKSKIEQLLRNLIGNAIKFSPAKSHLAIGLYKNTSTVRLEIVDQGPGIPDEDKDSIFDKFNQSSRTRTGTGGTGLGLAICAQIVQQHNGDIWVEDAMEGNDQSGARFVVIFPPY
ncbi:MAG: HAMP domain-containing histidine kinase [gamma proteobacterium symbiont of Bathyaustriella thionipta]|nr:HAMP domain-containing histidine kinase [gamma proteobacterium symbiont of Bathyaustriella thionipta]MCU7950404.1 HAMP domain-containing histidine kinase [gamma proteobacterium symbiont of Bathyaustriella thionipta]MCU7953655.1 HAMP domain-containing histidine kinase [gamma proteobacterium symbiont of Bathyaustriella thionipta]MCU7956906.1 HAMP domain-containing histidine kinase [gamma proteobacterium symbiont of Bathyaustriella thionipta]MCU7968169.1 HAMP domain-containing histidine kinase 